MDREREETRVSPHTPEQEDEQLRRLWRRPDPRAGGSGGAPPSEGYAEESETAEGQGWGPL